MAFFPLKLPPGLYRNGTEQQAAGRYYDANLVRWIDKALRPMGGWAPRSTADPVTGIARALVSWRDNSGAPWIGIGTSSKLYVQDASGTISDITPVGMTAGRDNATTNLGYGGGFYGRGTYGTPRSSTSTNSLPATVWTLDTFGQYLVGCQADDGKIYEWQLSTGTPAAVVANAPEDCRGIVVTGEGFVMALGADGNGRNVAWCEQRNNTVWTPAATNQAGDQDLETKGRLMCGKALKGLTLLFTDVDVWGATYLGQPYIYGFKRVGLGCGVISQGAVAAVDQQAMWMTKDGFWYFDGSVQPLNCDVYDLVFGDLNLSQASKVSAAHYGAFGEVWWFYPSATSNECDRYVLYNYRDNYWNAGALDRTCGTDKGVNPYPMMMGSDRILYEHERGWDYDGAAVYGQSGPVQLGAGDTMMEAQGLVPDDRTLGSVTATFAVRSYPDAGETTFGPYTLANPTDFLFQGRQVKVRFDGAVTGDWRVGEPKLDLVKGNRI